MNTNDDTVDAFKWGASTFRLEKDVVAGTLCGVTAGDSTFPIWKALHPGPYKETVYFNPMLNPGQLFRRMDAYSRLALDTYKKKMVVPELAESPPVEGLQFTYMENDMRYYIGVGSMQQAKTMRPTLIGKQYLELLDVKVIPVSQIDKMTKEEYKQSHEYKQDVAELERLKLKVGQ
jgi:hypothetical protein